MKYIIFTIAAILLFSCQKEPISKVQIDCIEVEYNASFTVFLDDEICLPDGSSFTIKKINDEFCPCDALCKWEGELKVIVETTNLEGEKSTFAFGSATYQLRPFLFENTYIEAFSYEYELGVLPDCLNEFDAKKIILELSISK
jgi:hypothetical protein